MKRIILCQTLALSLLPYVGEAKSVGHYSVAVRTNAMNELADLANAVGGWKCHASSSVKFTERLPDNQGRMKDVPRAYSHDFSAYRSDTKNELQIEKNMSRSDENLGVSLSQTCSREEPVVAFREVCTPSTDGTNYCYQEPYTTTETKTVHMSWDCDFRNDLPTRPGQTASRVCHPKDNSFAGYLDLERIFMKALNGKEIRVDARLDRVEEQYFRNFCGPTDKNKVVLQLSQGLGGHSGEDDFVLRGKIDGKHEFELPSKSGIIDEEIAYCGGGDQIKVDLEGKELDLFWDDEYVPVNSLALSRSGASSVGQVNMKRKSYTGATDRDHAVVVQVIDRSAKAKPKAEEVEEDRRVGAVGAQNAY